MHHLKKDGMNEYETAISKICTILSEYDSDQKYPVWGFGAKKDGTVNHCFQCGLEEEVAGVEGILGAYKQAFKSGVAMSKPTDITQVIRAAGKESRKCLVSDEMVAPKANACSRVGLHVVYARLTRIFVVFRTRQWTRAIKSIPF